MLKGIPSKRTAIIIAALCTIVWSSSFIVIKIGLEQIPALPFAGFRYVMAAIFMLPWLLQKSSVQAIRRITRKDMIALVIMGLLTYPLNQGCLFLAMSYLPNATVSLITNMNPVFLAVLGGIFLNEHLKGSQFAGIGLTVVGALVFFLPLTGDVSGIGVAFSFVTLFANVIGVIFTRKMLKVGNYPVVVITGLPMVFGAVMLGAVSGFWNYIPQINLSLFAILIFLSLINTTIAFTVWNVALQRLTAIEANVISNTMLVQIALLSWFFLGEPVTWKMVAGMALVIGGVILVTIQGDR